MLRCSSAVVRRPNRGHAAATVCAIRIIVSLKASD